jgi:hypothetical protein
MKMVVEFPQGFTLEMEKSTDSPELVIFTILGTDGESLASTDELRDDVILALKLLTGE